MTTKKKDLIVLGGGPGGYTAAFRAADLGRKVTIIEKEEKLGGVCLNVGCIPSKTLLHAAEVIEDSERISEAGIYFEKPRVDLEKLQNHKSGVISKLTTGLSGLAKARGVEIIHGTGSFKSNTELQVEYGEERSLLTFNDIIIAAGSRPVVIPGLPHEDPAIWDSTMALEINRIPDHLLIIGGGIIGLEMAGIYSGLGSKITIIEMAEEIIPAGDKDLKQPLLKKIKKRYEGIHTATKVTGITREGDLLLTTLEGKKAPAMIKTDAVLVAVGRKSNSDLIGLENTGIAVDKRGFIVTDRRQKTEVQNIYAIGDITGNPMLAHRAVGQGKTAAEAASGHSSAFTPMGIPSVAYTNPEIAWVGLTEKEAKEEGIEYRKAIFPWQASGRALSSMAENGLTKTLFDPGTGRIIGAGITGKNAGELISEAALAIEMGALAGDIGGTIHPHPTLSETFGLTGEIEEGCVTDILNT
ncbi:MAG: dihydrolipoyl dehydrogenase [Spirochaetales bacterium]|nr:dihydrolipoyl dehydrogenase [Spirochaetales bacterium]